MVRLYSTSYGALLASLILCNPAHGLAESLGLLHSFGPPPDATLPLGSLTADGSGRLYGSTSQGGQFGFGAIYRLTRPVSGSGAWTEEVLYSFAGPDGAGPNGGLIFDAAGLIYGTTALGGPSGGGEVFRLDPASGALTVLHAFSSARKNGANRRDGLNPGAGVIFGPGGLLYGTAGFGGDGEYRLNGAGVAFSVSPLGDTTEYAILHTFAAGNNQDGITPYSNLVVGGTNQFFGTTGAGGANGHGTIFSLTLNANNYWVERVVYSFAAARDVAYPQYEGALVRGQHNEMFGCAPGGGVYGEGGLFSLTPPSAAGKPWIEHVLYSFGAQAGDLSGMAGCTATAEISGRIIGTTFHGGNRSSYAGGIFELTPPAPGNNAWTYAVLHDFGQTGPGGHAPNGPLLPLAGTYYGVNQSSSPTAGGYGTVYSYKP